MTTPARAHAALRDAALAYPETNEEFPWGDLVIKVRGKVFLFMNKEVGPELGISVKLPHSGGVALMLPFAEPTGYGLGKSGWVSARFGRGDDVPVSMLLEWLDESFRAVAPTKVVAKLGVAPAPAAKGPATKKPAAKIPAAKKPAAGTPAAKKPAAKKPDARR